MSPQGKTLTQQRVKELAKYENIAFLCGHYEGIDERIIDEYIDEEISIGDYVLTGGELPALVVADSVCRMIDGVLSDDEGAFRKKVISIPFWSIPSTPDRQFGGVERYRMN